MHAPTNAELIGYWRRQLFWSWILASLFVGAFVCIAGPIANHAGVGQAFVALSVPVLMLFMLLTGYGWLITLMMFPPKWRNTTRRDPLPKPRPPTSKPPPPLTRPSPRRPSRKRVLEDA